MKHTDRSELLVLGAAGVAYVLFFVYMVRGLGFNMLQSDVLTYWRDSLNWRTPFSPWWVPGYSLLVAVIHGITFNALGPVEVMVLASGSAYLVAVRTVFRLAQLNRFPSPGLLALAFAVFPVVGLTFSVRPIADITAIALLLLTVLSFQKQRWGRFVLAAGACMFVQKVMWFFVPPLVLLAFVRHGETRRILPLAFLPILVWMVAGAFYHGDSIWFMRWSVEHLLTSKSALPVFDGLVTPLLSGSPAKVGKGVLVASVLVLSIVSLLESVRIRAWPAACVSLSLLLLVAFVNSFEIWVAVRYSKLLVIPAASLGERPGFRGSSAARLVAVWVALILAVASNLAYGYYMSRFDFG